MHVATTSTIRVYIRTEPKVLPCISDFEVAELHNKTLVTGWVEEHLSTKLIAGQARDAVVGCVGNQA